MYFENILAFLVFNSLLVAGLENRYTKVAVALGSSPSEESYLTSVEVFDLTTSNLMCKNLPDFPLNNNIWAESDLWYHQEPLICGGYIDQTACHILANNTWSPVASFNEGRYLFAMTQSPIPGDGSKLFVSGGSNGLKSTEVLTEQGWQVSTPLPVEVTNHCMVLVNKTTAIIIGGVHGNAIQPFATEKTLVFDGETKTWTKGPELKIPRRTLSCALINKGSSGLAKSVIAVGGYDSSTLASTEILDADSSEWRSGPELPYGIQNAAIVSDPSGGVVLIGGTKTVGDKEIVLNTMFRLKHAGPDAKWEEMPQKLKTARKHHTAFLIPDDVAQCKKLS